MTPLLKYGSYVNLWHLDEHPKFCGIWNFSSFDGDALKLYTSLPSTSKLFDYFNRLFGEAKRLGILHSFEVGYGATDKREGTTFIAHPFTLRDVGIDLPLVPTDEGVGSIVLMLEAQEVKYDYI